MMTCMSASMAIDSASQSNDADVLEAAFERFSGSIYRYILVRTGDRHLCEDLMQQLWIVARKSPRQVPSADLEFWLRGIARNLVRAHWRSQSRRPPHVPIADAALAAELSNRLVSEELPADELNRREVRDQLTLAITSLRSDDQTLIVGHYFHGRTHAQLAAALGIGDRAVEGRLYRARQALREALRESDE